MDDAKDAIRRRLAEVKTFLAREAPPRLSESDTKANFIEPIIAALGWQGIGVVTREYYVRNSQEFIDYVMAGSTGPLLAIEAKQLQTDLTDKHAAQLIQYCAVEGIEWAALTNGRELQFFNSFLKPDLAAKRVLRLDLLAFNNDAEFDTLFSQIWQLSRESMTKPSGVRTWLNQRRLDTALRAVLLDSNSATIRQLRKALTDAEISATPQDLVQWFRTHLGTPVTTLPKGQPPVTVGGTAPTQSPVPPAAEDSPWRDSRGRAGFPEPAHDRTSERTPALMDSLRHTVSDRLPETVWRTTTSYTAAEIDGHTFLAARTSRRKLVLGLSLPATTATDRLADNSGQFKWARITKIAHVAGEAEIDEELLALIEAARFHAAAETRRKAHYGVTLRELIEAGFLLPGTRLMLVGPGNRDFARAQLTATGEIEWDGTTYRSPSDRTFAELFGRPTLNGWDHWHAELPQGRESLSMIRARMLESMRDAELADSSSVEGQASGG